MNIAEIREEKYKLEKEIEALIDAFVIRTRVSVDELDGHSFLDGKNIFDSNVIVTLEKI